MSKYGRTKLDHALSYFCMAFEKILEFMSIIFVPLLIVQQTALYSENNPEVMIPVLSVAMILVVAVGVIWIRRKK